MKKARLFLKSFPMAGRIFYNPSLKQFVQVKAMYWTGAECGGHCNFYADAQTTTVRQMLSYDQLANYLLVGDIDKFEHAEIVTLCKNYVAWKAR